jgi:hypothetical protein
MTGNDMKASKQTVPRVVTVQEAEATLAGFEKQRAERVERKAALADLR